ncbi:MAG: UDP-glucose/GDP-mannose dehydrogenase family protein [Planctomycetota bacterium]
MNISIIGCGYVGLVTAVCFAEKGHHVLGVDNDEQKIRVLQAGNIPIYEPGLLELAKNLSKNKLMFSNRIKDAVSFADIIFISVGTPLGQGGGADLSQVKRVAREVALNLNYKYKIVAEKSTVPVGTADQLKETIKRYAPLGACFDVVSNPEFLQEGRAIKTTLHPDRIVVGVETRRAENIIRKLYSSFKAPLLITDLKSAELIKHASNSFLATKISYINAIADICEKSGADVRKVAYGMGLDKRIGKEFLRAGIGYGGFCLPKDVSAFVHIAEKLGCKFDLLKAVQSINREQRRHFLRKIEKACGSVKGKKIAVMGLSFKPDTDDIRESPAIDIIRGLINKGAKVAAYDPKAMINMKKIIPPGNIQYVNNPYNAATGADCLVITTEWDEFKNLDLKRLKRIMNKPLIVDGRNIFDPLMMRKQGFLYVGIGFK